MAEPKYVQVPEIEEQGCLGCPLQHRVYVECIAVYRKNGLPMSQGGEITSCLDTKTILMEDTPEGRRRYAIARMTGEDVDE